MLATFVLWPRVVQLISPGHPGIVAARGSPNNRSTRVARLGTMLQATVAPSRTRLSAVRVASAARAGSVLSAFQGAASCT